MICWSRSIFFLVFALLLAITLAGCGGGSSGGGDGGDGSVTPTLDCSSTLNLASDNGYVLTDVTGCLSPFNQITAAELTLRDDDLTGDYVLPFTFPFYGADVTTITVDTNGNLWMGPGVSYGYDFDLPTGGGSQGPLVCLGNPVISPWNNDLDSYFYGDGARVQAKSAPQRVVITWDTETWDDGNYSVVNKFTTVLYPNGYIAFHYNFMHSDVTCTDSGSGISKADNIDYIDLTASIGASVCAMEGHSFLFEPAIAGDSDGDGLTDAEESALGTDPAMPDTDLDDLKDGWEVYITTTDPLLAPIGIISGQVDDSLGNGLSGVRVTIAGLASVTTDGNGDYALNNLPLDTTYTLGFSLAGHAFADRPNSIMLTEAVPGIFNQNATAVSFSTAAITNYTLSEVTGETQLTSGLALTAVDSRLRGDDLTLDYTMPWAFPFYSATYTGISLDTNGNLWMGPGVGSDFETDLAAIWNPFIAVWNQDLISEYYGQGVRAQDLGDRVLFDWETETFDDYDTNRLNRFKAVLFPNGYILFHYQDFDPSVTCDEQASGSGLSNGDTTNYISLISLPGAPVACTLGGKSFLFEPVRAADTDTDGDGLSDTMEADLGTNPTNEDTDGDGLKDGWEVFITRSDPLN